MSGPVLASLDDYFLLICPLLLLLLLPLLACNLAVCVCLFRCLVFIVLSVYSAGLGRDPQPIRSVAGTHRLWHRVQRHLFSDRCNFCLSMF